MPRAIWSGAISFGLVNVPVKCYSAVSRKDVRFHQLHAADGVRIQQKRICPADGAEVPYEEIVKGYEIAPDQYVVITPDELEALDPEASRTIDIEDFVDIGEIDPIYYERTYYLTPDKGAAKAFALLTEAMSGTGKAGIARVVLRNKQHLVSIRPLDGVLAMTTMLFADEVVDSATVRDDAVAVAEPRDREVEMARQLIGALTSEFDPTRYRDEYRERVLELIERKAEGEQVVAQPAAEQASPVVDIMAALQASLEATRASQDDTEPAPARRKSSASKRPRQTA